jgi:hypothetical protein
MRLTRWRELWHLHLAVERVLDHLTPEQRAVVADADVEAIEKETQPDPKATNEEVEARRVAVLEQRLLDEAEDTLRYVLASAERRLDAGVEQELVEDSRRVEDLASTVGVGSVSRPLAERQRLLRLPAGRDGADNQESGLWRLFTRLQRGDYFWTLLSGLVAATAYTLTIWDETWGTITDYATAFTAGFLTETVVNWAILPAFQSYRTHRRVAAHEAKESRNVLQDLEATLKRALGAQSPPASGSETPRSD